MANLIGLNIKKYVINAEDQNLTLSDPENVTGPNISSFFGGGYFLANPPGWAVIDGVSVLINPNYTTKIFIPSDENDPNFDPTTNYQSTLVHYGPVTLTAKNGNNTVTGDMTSFTFMANASVPHNSFSTDPDTLGQDIYLAQYTEIQNMTLKLGHLDGDGMVDQGNTITVGNGNNTIYGNMHDLNFISKVTAQSVGGNDYSLLDAYYATKGSDMEAVLLNIEADMGHNIIKAGNGNNSIYGDIYSLNFEAIGGGIAPHGSAPGVPGSIGSGISQAIIGFTSGHPVVMAGYNSITVGNGNSVIAGDSHDISIVAKGGYNDSFGSFPGATMSAIQIFEGHNTILASGSGNRSIAGATFNFTLEAIGGVADNGRNSDASITASRTNPNGADFTNNSITVKGSGNSTIFGSTQHVTLEAIGGKVLANGYLFDPGGDQLNPLTGLDDRFSAVAEASISNYRTFLGHNLIDMSQSTGNTTIFGDTQDINYIVTGGTVNGDGGAAAAFITNTRITMGSDVILGGKGNTIIWSNAQEVDFEFNQGHNNATIQSHGNADVAMGPTPFLYDDPIYNQTQQQFGNFFEQNGVSKFARPQSGNILTFEGNTITAGSGNTVIHSHVGDFDGLSRFLNEEGYLDFRNPDSLGNNNRVIFGDDIMTGGAGKDKFVFELMDIGNGIDLNPFVMQGSTAGYNVIKSFQVGRDSLEFDGLTKSQFLQYAHVSDVGGPNDGTLITFGSYSKDIGTAQFYGASNNHGISELNAYAIFLDPNTNQEVVSIVNYDASDPDSGADALALKTALEGAGLLVVTTPLDSNLSLGTNTLVSGAPLAHLDIDYADYTVKGSLLIEDLHLTNVSANGLIQALGAANVVVVV